MNNNLNNNIIIGAAQLGTNYGIANSNKQFKLEERVNFLDFAYSDLREVINFGSKNFNKLWDTRSWS